MSRPLSLSVGAVAYVLMHQLDGMTNLQAIQPLSVALFIIACATLSKKLPDVPDISFGLYLWHAPVIQLMNESGNIAEGTESLAIVCLVTIVLATISWYVIEKPGIGIGRTISDRFARRSVLTNQVNKSSRTLRS